jgi:hypothetical protein
MDKTEERLENWCNPQNISFISKEAEENYRKRTRRIANAILLKPSDRIPVTPSFGVFTALDNGYTVEETFLDFNKSREACLKTLKTFDTDIGISPRTAMAMYSVIDYKPLKLPGIHIPATVNFQYVEDEYVSAEQFYDHFLDDPSDFLLRVFLPRVCGLLEPFKNLPPINETISYLIGLPSIVAAAGSSEITQVFTGLAKASRIITESSKLLSAYTRDVKSMGYPFMEGAASAAPFDVIGDYIRGTKGTLIDMYRRPEKLIAAMEKLVPYMISLGIRAKRSGGLFVRMPLHKNSDSFMSREQFKTFYWPTLRKVFMAFIDEGLIPLPFFEGDNTHRLDIINDIPKGKAVYQFQNVDLNRFKELCGDVVCFNGNVPASLLATGTPEQVIAYVKNLMDIVGKNGGLIVNGGSIIDEAKHENIKAMVDFTKSYKPGPP